MTVLLLIKISDDILSGFKIRLNIFICSVLNLCNKSYILCNLKADKVLPSGVVFVWYLLLLASHWAICREYVSEGHIAMGKTTSGHEF